MASRRASTADIAVTSVVGVLAMLAAAGSFFYSLFFVFAADACPPNCSDAVLFSAYAVTWGGIALALLIAVVGITVSARHGRMMWLWPTLALAVIVVTFFVGVHLVDSLFAPASR